jgi:hypothetical protein
MISFPDTVYFRVWDYQVSHDWLNLRSSRVAQVLGEDDENIDIVFGGVEYMELPNVLKGLTIDMATVDEAAYLASRCREPHSDAVIYNVLITNGGMRYYVVGGKPYVSRNRLPFTTSALEAERESVPLPLTWEEC